ARAMGDQLRQDRLADGAAPGEVEADVQRSQARIANAPAAIVACATMQVMDDYPDEKRRAAEEVMAAQSVAMAVQNLLLAADAEGLGACWMCAPLFCGQAVTRSLDLPSDWQPQALITLGYPSNGGKPASRAALRKVAVWFE
ncbi:MAG TPA: nitroreductase family protein, partial [Thermoflexales bacterium]|nr:nitroreductase family protein [Thermoflexales bacterium]